MIKGHIFQRPNGSYVLGVTEANPQGTYHATDSSQITRGEVESYLAEHPEALVPEPVPPPPTPEVLTSQARALRDARLAANDRQIIIASRAQRTGDPAATVRLAALDAYAVALCDWPESEGFPDLSTIPVTPIIN